MKYFKHIITEDSVTRTRYFQPEGTNMCIPETPKTVPDTSYNADYVRMMEEVAAGTSTIEEVDDTP